MANGVEEFNEQAHMAKFRAGITPSGLMFNKAPEFTFVEGQGPNAMKSQVTAPVVGGVDNPWVVRSPNAKIKTSK